MRARGGLPGSLQVDHAEAFDKAAQRLRPLADLRRLFRPRWSDGPVMNYCNTGHQAATNWFVLSELFAAGPGATLYDGLDVAMDRGPGARGLRSGRRG